MSPISNENRSPDTNLPRGPCTSPWPPRQTTPRRPRPSPASWRTHEIGLRFLRARTAVATGAVCGVRCQRGSCPASPCSRTAVTPRDRARSLSPTSWPRSSACSPPAPATRPVEWHGLRPSLVNGPASWPPSRVCSPPAPPTQPGHAPRRAPRRRRLCVPWPETEPGLQARPRGLARARAPARSTDQTWSPLPDARLPAAVSALGDTAEAAPTGIGTLAAAYVDIGMEGKAAEAGRSGMRRVRRKALRACDWDRNKEKKKESHGLNPTQKPNTSLSSFRPKPSE
jgi:hypothetical protein